MTTSVPEDAGSPGRAGPGRRPPPSTDPPACGGRAGRLRDREPV